jgi:hypothetical protein
MLVATRLLRTRDREARKTIPMGTFIWSYNGTIQHARSIHGSNARIAAYPHFSVG